MRAHDGQPPRPGPRDDFDPCEFHSSDGWVLVEALITILTGVATILLVVVRHPFRFLAFVILIAVIGTITGWWTP
jgi:hypothetical protein